MNAVVILFRDKIRTTNAVAARVTVQPKQPARGVLTCIWRTNPASGRPECHWFMARREAADEGGSCPGLWRRTA